MAIIYHVTVEAAKKENVFHIKYTDNKNTTHSFEQSASNIMPEEVEWMWKDRRNQLRIGEKLFRFLDGDGHYLQQALKEADNHAETLQVYLSTCPETNNWPFELLAHNGSFLLPTQLHFVRSVPVRAAVKELPSQNRRLRLLFMACSPLDVQSKLDFEKEEEAIFKITERLAVDMEVEDSGSLQGLREKLEQQQYDIIHISGHADIDKRGQPFFVMENETGYRDNVSADELWAKALKVNPPRLLFISGNRTGDAPGETEGSFAYRLVDVFHVPAVLGWGRPVSDMEANEASKMIYRELSRGKSILHAVQRARYQLINSFSSILKPAWPLLRLFSSGGSLNAIVKAEQEWQPQVRRMTHIYLRNSQVKVLGEGFVGRRRQLQQSLWVLKQEPQKIGLLVLGTGGLGKSCLAGKVSERFERHTLIVIRGRLNAITLESALKDAFIVRQDDNGKQILSQKIEMADKLIHLCSSSFKEKNYLFLLDDFEQNLEGSEKGEPGRLLPEAAELLKVLLDYLPDGKKMTQLIITCRYGFSLTVKDRNLVKERLDLISLAGFRESEQWKKVTELKTISTQQDPSTVGLLLAAGCGNPRLMEWLNVLVGQLKASEVPELLKAVSEKKEDFIRDHVIRELLQRGGDELTCFLRWFAIFRRPVLKVGAKIVGAKAGLKRWEDLLHRGMDLSLIEHDRAHASYQGTPLLRDELLNQLDNLQDCHEAAVIYYKTECGDKPEAPFNPIMMEEWIYHALGCGEEETASEQGCFLIKYLRYRLAFLEAHRLGLWIMGQKKRKMSSRHDLSLLNIMAVTISNFGDHRKAIEYYQTVLNIWKDKQVDKHPDMATALNNLGASWQALGEHGKAIGYYRKALRINEAVFGRKHFKVSILLNNLGAAYQELGSHRKAIGYFEEALTIDEALFGRQHSNVAGELNNLGLTWYELGDYRKAINYCQEALTIDKAISGWVHPRVARELDNLGSGWRALGEPKKAAYYFQEALTIDETLFGRQHPNVAKDLNNLGGAWDDLGCHRKAIDCYQEALAIDEKIFGPQHPNIATRKINLGHSWRILGEPKKALDYFEQALTIDELVFGRGHPNVARDLNNLGAAWQELGNYKKAIDHYQEALRIDEAAFGRQHINAARNLNNQGTVWKTLGDLKKAMDCYQEAMRIDEAIFGQQHPNVAIPLNNIGLVWKALKQPKKALDCFEKAMNIDEAAYGAKHPNMARHLNNLGSAWKDLGEPKKAIAYFQQALTIWRDVYTEKHPHVAAGLSNLGLTYFSLGERETAKNHFQEAYTIYNELFGPKHPDTKMVAGWLETLAKGE